MIQGHNPVHIIVVSYDCGGSKYTHDATKDGIVLGIKVIIKVLLIVVSLSLLNLQLEKIYKKNRIKCTDRKRIRLSILLWGVASSDSELLY